MYQEILPRHPDIVRKIGFKWISNCARFTLGTVRLSEEIFEMFNICFNYLEYTSTAQLCNQYIVYLFVQRTTQ